MAGIPPNSLRQDELPEYQYVGPFGGIQSEVPLDKIGNTGFAEVQNIIFRKSGASMLSQFVPLITPRAGSDIADLTGEIGALTGIISALSSLSPSEPVMGIADFFNVDGTRCFVVMTPTRMYQWTGGAWLQITGTLTGSDEQFFSWDVIGYKLYFSQQKDKVQVWDGITTGFANASSSAVPGKYLCELDFHLLVANTIESGSNAPNRVHWTGIGDGTDWTSFSSGQTDLFNGLGPINGLARIYQAAYAFQQWGITQIVPTGIGTAPFQFITMGSRAKGSILPYGVASFGEIVACYVGKDNIYMFDGTESIPIGSRPISGSNSMLGARQRIFTDLYNTTLANVTGFINTSNNGIDYESYWLIIPGLNKAWVYHFDEQNWTQIYFDAGRLVGPVGIFAANNSGSPEIIQLVGTIAQQSWSFESLTNVAPLDTMAISDGLANSPSLLTPGVPGIHPTNGGIQPGDGWYIRSGQLEFDDPRHNHSTKKVRISLIDLGANATVYLRFTNEFGQRAVWPNGPGQTTDVYQFTYGTGSGATLKFVVPLSLQGKYITWEMAGQMNINWGMSEFTIVYDVSGEVQNNR